MRWPSGVSKSIAIERLPRLQARLYDELKRPPSLSSMNGGPQPRVSSPAPGRSTLITSAPRSASVWPAQGPARMRASSSTRTPASGPFCGPDMSMSSFPDFLVAAL